MWRRWWRGSCQVVTKCGRGKGAIAYIPCGAAVQRHLIEKIFHRFEHARETGQCDIKLQSRRRQKRVEVRLPSHGMQKLRGEDRSGLQLRRKCQDLHAGSRQICKITEKNCSLDACADGSTCFKVQASKNAVCASATRVCHRCSTAALAVGTTAM